MSSKKRDRKRHRTQPARSTASSSANAYPPGIPHIIGNEAAERFSFYGMKSILTVFMTKYMLDHSGQLDVMKPEDAKFWYHIFGMAVYAFPLLGSLLSDIFLGKYRTIIALSIVYCLGHLALAIDDTRWGLFAGLALISLGAGGIKPCVSAHVGDQFTERNRHLLPIVFSWFYLAINAGAFISQLSTPVLLQKHGPHVAFGVPGLLMVLATVVFYMGRTRFIAIPPKGLPQVLNSLGGEGGAAICRLIPLFLCVSLFWGAFDQTGSSWVLQAGRLDLQWMGVTWLESQVQAANALLILVFVPLFSYWLYPTIDKVLPLTPLRKATIGFALAAMSVTLIAIIDTWLDAGQTVNVSWQLLAFVILTAAEVMISITFLEFAYTQAPHEVKSFVMSLNLASVALGNFIAAGMNGLMSRDEAIKTALAGANYHWAWVAGLLVAGVCMGVASMLYRDRSYIASERPAS